MKATGWRDAEDVTSFPQMKAGGYICRIVDVSDVPDKEYLKISYDIAEGELKGYYQGLNDRFDKWHGNFIKSYKETALPFFKAFITAVEESNSGYRFDDNEETLKGKLVGLVIGQEEYRKLDGTIGKRWYINQVRSIQAIKSGKFAVPEFKKLKDESTGWQPAESTDDDDLPF